VTGTVGALVWTYLVSGILVDLLQFLGMLSKLSSTYLALTVIAVGNALPDGVTTISLSKQGYAVMGLTGGYAGQLFGLLVGFGLSLLKKTLQSGP
jgi:Ca2+/Na+ antiporter